MSFRGALGRGLSACSRRKAVAVFCYSGTTLMALPAAAFLGAVVDRRFGHSGESLRMATGLDPLLFMELIHHDGAMLSMVGLVALALMILYLPASVFFDGAVVASTLEEPPPPLRRLLARSGAVFFRLLRLKVLSAFFMLLLLGGAAVAASKLVGPRIDESLDEGRAIAIRAAVLTGLLLLYAVLSAAAELAKIHAVARDEPRAILAFARGWRSAWTHPFVAPATVAIFALAAVALTLGGSLLDVRIPRSSIALIFVGWGLQQGLTLLRAAGRVGLTAALLPLQAGDPGGLSGLHAHVTDQSPS